MPFKDRFVNDQITGHAPPGKFYYSTFGREAFGNSHGQQISGVMEYIREAIRQPGEPRELFYGNWEFMVGLLWGDNGQKVMDVFGATQKEIESGNPEIEGWVVRNGVARREGGISCLQGLNVAVAELNLRVESDSLLRYLHAEMPRLPFVSGETHYLRL